jgi:hypothetical protein
MTSTTRGEIMDILKEVDFNTGFDLMNMLYGLFDGYLYDDLLEVASGAKVDNVLYNRIKNVVSVIKNYKL